MSATIEVRLNGSACALPAGATVDAAVSMLTTATTGVAVAVNDSVVPRSTWPERALAAGDRVEVLTAVQGG